MVYGSMTWHSQFDVNVREKRVVGGRPTNHVAKGGPTHKPWGKKVGRPTNHVAEAHVFPSRDPLT
jgi:hypothetical protein